MTFPLYSMIHPTSHPPSIYVNVRLSTPLPLQPSIPTPICPSIHMHKCVCHTYHCLSLHPCMHPSVDPHSHTHTSRATDICPAIYQSIHPFVCVCLPIQSNIHSKIRAFWDMAPDSSNAIYSYQVRCMHVHVMAPGQRLYG
jgi:hypothetical protein